MSTDRIVRLQDDAATDPAVVGVKNSRLAELSRDGIRVPAGFVVTATAYEEFVREGRLGPVIAREIRRYRAGRDLRVVAAAIRTAFGATSLPPALADDILAAYEELGGDGTEVAVRCSPITPQEGTRDELFLHLNTGADVLAACRRCFADLFSAAAVGNRELCGPDHLTAAMPVTVQLMVRSDRGGSGTVHGESSLVRVSAAWGLGEPAADDPDQFSIYPGSRPMIIRHRGAKRTKTVYAGRRATSLVPTTPKERNGLVLSDGELQVLAQWSVLADARCKRRMELDWAKDGVSGQLYVVEARPLTFPSIVISTPSRAGVLQH
ncbi:PEP/pyruvate-binding domain-containing protein [Kribbella sp. NPDC050281]|uniref:PEP/pyruvate-binding domain-containing protein n=1 Tax=Kribbella sp. NPDC050281 TaxID=3155515 RepID=UPI0033E3474F